MPAAGASPHAQDDGAAATPVGPDVAPNVAPNASPPGGGLYAPCAFALSSAVVGRIDFPRRATFRRIHARGIGRNQ